MNKILIVVFYQVFGQKGTEVFLVKTDITDEQVIERMRKQKWPSAEIYTIDRYAVEKHTQTVLRKPFDVNDVNRK